MHANTLLGSAQQFDDIAFLAGSGAPAGLYGYMRNVCFGSIVLKKSAMVSTVEKYAREIKIFALNRGFQVLPLTEN